MNRPQVVSQHEWQTARDALLIQEKQLTRELDALAADRRRLPMVRLDAAKYQFTAPGRQSGFTHRTLRRQPAADRSITSCSNQDRTGSAAAAPR